MDKSKRHEELCKEIHDVYVKKNNDYGDSVHELYEKLGPITLLTRLGDKYNRLCSLLQKDENERQVKDENIIDTLMDLANYALMGCIEIEQQKNKYTTLSNDSPKFETEEQSYNSTLMKIKEDTPKFGISQRK